jgi:hypothetical protein
MASSERARFASRSQGTWFVTCLVAVSISIAVSLAACEASESPLASTQPTSHTASILDELLPFSPDSVLIFLVPPNLFSPRHAEKLIKADTGGFVELSGFRVDIPAGALQRNTMITIDLPTSLPAASYVVADFGPTGLSFAKPVKLTFPLVGVNLLGFDLTEIAIWFWDGTQWRDPVGQATLTSVSGKTTHFSTYGARGGIDTTSGGAPVRM